MSEKKSVDEKISVILKKFDTKAVIFDLDGTLLDNNSFHRKTWEAYLKNIEKVISPEEFNAYINGRTNKDAIEYIYGRKMSEEESTKYTLEKESLYRKLYKPFIKPVPGLLHFLEILHKKNIPMAIATSGIQPNIDFMFENLPIKHYFKVIVNSSHIMNGKPHPEIYLKAASQLDISPKNCLVFEDAVVGIRSAKAAGMKVVALTTTHTAEDVHEADLIIKDYTEICLTKLRELQPV